MDLLGYIGYKVGRVDQVETALGAEMRLASDKSKGKKTAGEKIVRRCVSHPPHPYSLQSPVLSLVVVL